MRNSIALRCKVIYIKLDENFKNQSIKTHIRKAYTDKYKKYKAVGSIKIDINILCKTPLHNNQPVPFYDSIKPNNEINTLNIIQSVIEALTKTAFIKASQIVELSVSKQYGNGTLEVIIEELL